MSRRRAATPGLTPGLALGLALGLVTSSACLGPVDEEVPLLAVHEPRGTAVEFEAKLERYFACLDSLEPKMRESRQRYLEVIDARGRRLPARTYRFGVDRSAFRTCRVAVADANVMPPSRPLLEATAKAMVTVAMEYADRSRRLGRAPAPGESAAAGTADERLELDWERYETALEGFVEQLEDERSNNDPRLLEELSERDDLLPFHIMAVTVHARSLLACLTRDPSPVQGECDPFRAPFEEANAAMQETLGARSEVFWSDAFRTNSAALAELVSAAFDRLRTGALRPLDRARLRRTHADLVRDASTLRIQFF